MTDLVFAARALRKNLGFSVVAGITLALGIGANTAVFSVVKAVLLNQLPYRQPDRLVEIAESTSNAPRPITIDFTTTYDLKARSHSFESVSLYRRWADALTGQGAPELVSGMRVGYDYFDTLGVKMQLGRTFLPEEDRPDRWHELILSHGFWRRQFGGDPTVIGRVVRLGELSFTIVGVLPASFEPVPLSQSDNTREIFAPLGYGLADPFACRGCQHLRLIARLKPGISAGVANAELSTLMSQIVREHPADYSRDEGVTVTSLRDYLVGRVSTALWILMGASGLVLLIACANVANLLLARATDRSKEIALRAALGAGRWRLIRQLLTESLLLALIGGLAGLLLALGGTSLLASLGPTEIPRVKEIAMDAPVLWFGLAASMLTGVLFGLAPALRATGVDLNESLKDAGKATGGRSRHGLRNLLAAAEMALAFVLVVSATLLGKSFLRLMNVDAGYDPHNVLTLSTHLYGARYRQPEAQLGYYNEVMERVRATPGVESVAMVSTLPLSGFDRSGFHIQDRRLPNPSDAPSLDRYSVAPDYFRVMKIPLKRGRIFTDQDREGAPLVAAISESGARSQFPGEDPIGKHIQLGGRDDSKPWMTIVGVVGDVRQYGLDRRPDAAVYIPQAQHPDFSYILVARTTIDPGKLERAVRDAFLAVDKTQPVFDVQPMDVYLQASLAERKFTLVLLGLFGALALALAAVGVYGVISYAVSLRTREVGIRMALGAQRGDVLKLILRQGFTLAGAGLAAGFVASLALTKLLTTLLYEVRPTDVPTSAVVALLLALVALAASYLPARRATKLDPMAALRFE